MLLSKFLYKPIKLGGLALFLSNEQMFLVLFLLLVFSTKLYAQGDPFLYDEADSPTQEEVTGTNVEQESEVLSGSVSNLLDMAGIKKDISKQDPLGLNATAKPQEVEITGDDAFDYMIRKEAERPVEKQYPFGDRLEELEQRLKDKKVDSFDRRSEEKLFFDKRR